MVGPTIQRLQLGQQLRRRRKTAGKDRADRAAAIECSEATITNWESGVSSPRKPDMLLFLEVCGANAEEIQTLEELRLGAKQRGWWSTAKLPPWLGAYVGLEADADTLRTWSTGLVPGLLQTECYARELHKLAPHLTPPEDVDRRVQARMERQARLKDGLDFTAIIDEAVLRRCAGQASIAAPQLQKLLTVAELPNVTLRVLPFGAGLHSSMAGSFSLLTFPSGPDDHSGHGSPGPLLLPVAYQEYAVGGHLIDEQSVVSSLTTVYDDELCVHALDASESLDLIAKLVDHIS